MTRAVGLVVLLGLGACAGNGSVEPACGTQVVRGAEVHTYCGDATVTVQTDDAVHGFTGGECRVEPDRMSVAAGTLSSQDPDLQRELDFFVMQVGTPGDAAPGDGTYDVAAVTFMVGGTSYTLTTDVSVTLREGRRRGEFAGAAVSGDDRPVTVLVSGSFHCDGS